MLCYEFLNYKIIIINVNKLLSPLKAILVKYSFSFVSYFELNICTEYVSRVAQWKRAGPITQRSVDRNHALL